MSDPGVNLLPGANRDSDKGCLAIRPEHVLLPGEADQTFADAKVFDMQVDSVERSGDETFVHGRVISNDNTTNEQHWVVRRPGMHSVSVGEMLALRLRGEDILNLALN
ncbi:MAG: TOBE domain-containing protein [OM182 bacterium]|nr:MAG: TOBE domain-containing protein [OM182 bacterium]